MSKGLEWELWHPDWCVLAFPYRRRRFFIDAVKSLHLLGCNGILTDVLTGMWRTGILTSVC